MEDQLMEHPYFWAPFYGNELQQPVEGESDPRSQSTEARTEARTEATSMQILPGQEQLHAQPHLDEVTAPVPSPVIQQVELSSSSSSTNVMREWEQNHSSCSSDNDTNVKFLPPHKVSQKFTSPRNSPITPTSLSSQSDSMGSHSPEQVRLGLQHLLAPTDATLPSPCTDNVEKDSHLLVVNSDDTTCQWPLENKDPTGPSYMCLRCRRKRVNTMLIPCRHVILCIVCACRIIQYSSALMRRCPCCGKSVEGVNRC